MQYAHPDLPGICQDRASGLQLSTFCARGFKWRMSRCISTAGLVYIANIALHRSAVRMGGEGAEGGDRALHP